MTRYEQVLKEAWALHLKPKAADVPTVISTFAGGGGSSLGYSIAGFRELLAVEWDKHACEVFKLNFPDVPIYCGDVTKLSVEQCQERAGIREGEVDVLDGSPPCQSFSLSGKRQLDDARGQLYHEFVRLLRGLKPKAFVMENVSGMVRGKMKLIFADCLSELKASGYKVKAKLLNSRFYDVPQSRERLIFIGVRDDLNIEPSHPIGNQNIITASQALVGCEVGKTPLFKDNYAKFWCHLPEGKTLSDLTGGKGFNTRKLHPHRPASTLLKTQRGHGFGTLCHWKEPRAISAEEGKRLQSFPDEFQLIGNYYQQWAIIGNSVPPLFMKAIAEHIKKLLTR
jgi:DNA (cytosine-5)-methyltransferase 1